MTNTKPTWEDDFDREFILYGDETEYMRDLKTFIQKVEQEAYERGKNDKKCCEGCFEHV